MGYENTKTYFCALIFFDDNKLQEQIEIKTEKLEASLVEKLQRFVLALENKINLNLIIQY